MAPPPSDGLPAVADITYTAWSQVGQEELGTSSTNAYITNTYDPNTGSLTDTQVQNTAASSTPYDNTSYTYDPSGNITSETDTRDTTATGSQAEQQCFSYDTLDQLTQAWTSASGSSTACSAGPSTGTSGTVGDGIPGGTYWTQWAYNPLGDQASETDNSVTGGTATEIAYTYNGNGASQPNTLTSSATTGGATASTTWTYDAAGNTTSQATGTSSTHQCYDYNALDQLSQAWTDTTTPCPAGLGSTATSITSYVYDADGNLLATDDPASDTLDVFGEQITADISNGTTTAITGIRYMPLPGGGQVVRTGIGINYYYETSDLHGTSLLALPHTLQNPVWRQFTPYGTPRGTPTGTWPDTHGYLGDPVDTNTSLTTIGARQYDPATGRFLTVDPVLEAGDPTQMGGYAYAADNPVTQSDPSGLCTPHPGYPCPTGPINTTPGGGGTPTGGCAANPSLPGCNGTPTTNSGGTTTTTWSTDVADAAAAALAFQQAQIAWASQQAFAAQGNPVLAAGSPGTGCGPPLLPGCEAAGHYGFGVSDLGGGIVAGYLGYGKFASEAGRDLGNPALSDAQLSVAGSQMRNLQLNPGMMEAEQFARSSSGALNTFGAVTAIAGGALLAWGYHAGGDPWWQASIKAGLVTGASFGGSFIGASLGFAAGAALVPADFTGVPEVVGAVSGGLAGGYAGGTAMSDLLNAVWP